MLDVGPVPAVSVLINNFLSFIRTRAYCIQIRSGQLTGRSVSGSGEIKTHKHVTDVNQDETRTFGSMDQRPVVINIRLLGGVHVVAVIRKLG